MYNDNSLTSGTVLQGSSYGYEIVKVLGQGSFGITYLAKLRIQGCLGSIDSSVSVAVKEFFMKEINGREGTTVTSGSKDGLFADYRRKFVREATNLSRLKHPHIVNVLEAFEANNTCYYVMEYIDGGSLDDYISKNNGLKEDDAIRIVKQVGSALSFMHSQGMLHLDLKPLNIMRKVSGDIVLIDFGLSKQYDADGTPESSTTVGGGTPGYAPIEQASYRDGKGFPTTMDIYALGATMYKMLTGKRAPDASDILNDGFPLYRLQERNVSEGIAASIAKAMAPARKDRYSTVESFIDSFDNEETILDIDVVVADKNSHKRDKTENVFNVRPNTSRVTFEFLPGGYGIRGGYFCSVDKNRIDPNITQESTYEFTELNEQEYKKFLSDLQALDIKIRNTVTDERSGLWVSLEITLYDENYKVYNRLWIAKGGGDCGNIDGDILELESKIREIVPGLQKYIDGPYYEAPVRPVDLSDALRPAPGIIAGHVYVDLGLSVKWATCNVGADQPSDYGDYFAWGETSPKEKYTKENSVTYGKIMDDKPVEKPTGIRKFMRSIFGDSKSNISANEQLSDIAGDSRYDAARANWGGTWRMPTEAEIEELVDKCKTQWTTQGGHNGYLVTGPNGNSIFLPAAGWRYGSSLKFEGEYGYYWSSTPCDGNTEYAFYLFFNSGSFGRNWSYRYRGYTVRPVSE